MPATAGAQRVSADTVSSQDVKGAIQEGVAKLRQLQEGDGSWSGMTYPGGVTALSLLAMLNAGTSPDDPAIVKGLSSLRETPNSATYVVGLKCQVYAATGNKKYAKDLQEAADWLAETQLPTGMWGYGNGGRGDNSNTQFAMLGLHEAANAGAQVKAEVWERARKHFENSQNTDGGWSYQYQEGPRGFRGGNSYGSMTAAGVASLYICGERLNVGAGPKVFQNGAYPFCGKYVQNAALAGGLKWLGQNFSASTNPRSGAEWRYYYLYALERVGMLSGLQHLGSHDWYREGAAQIVQNRRWNRTHDIAFAVLFLAKGNRPVLIQKVQWAGQWNRNIHDLENLTAFIGDKLGKPVTWQSVSLDAALEDLRFSPIALITGHEFPKLSPAQKDRLRQFVETGGTLLVEACCGSPAARKGFREFAAEAFPEYRLHPLEAGHPLFSSLYQIEDAYGIEGIDVGCRTGVIFSPNALSCLWELKTIPQWSDKAFKLGANIAAYATGKEQLPDKLDVVVSPGVSNPAAKQPAEVPRGVIRLARLAHNGDCDADMHAMTNLAKLLRDKAKVDVVAQEKDILATDEKLFEYPVVFMTGHYSFTLSDKEIAALRLYLQRGGFLLADACCGKEAFDKSFRQMARQLFPEAELKPLPPDHPLYDPKMGLPLGELRYRQVLADELKSRGTTQPPLEAVTLEGRTAILYSKYDFCCGLEGDNPYSCRGYVDADAQKLAINLILYAVSY